MNNKLIRAIYCCDSINIKISEEYIVDRHAQLLKKSGSKWYKCHVTDNFYFYDPYQEKVYYANVLNKCVEEKDEQFLFNVNLYDGNPTMG